MIFRFQRNFQFACKYVEKKGEKRFYSLINADFGFFQFKEIFVSFFVTLELKTSKRLTAVDLCTETINLHNYRES